MNSIAKGSATLTALAVFIFGGVSRSELSHGDAPQGNVRGGATCPALPDGVALIAGLRTGWTMPGASSAVRLVFSDQALPCEEPDSRSASPNETCTDSWRLTLTLPSELQAPATYDLSDHQVTFSEVITSGVPKEGCGSPGCDSTGGGGRVSDGVLEIYAVTEDCIAGRIHRLNHNQSSGPDYTGGFLASRCEPMKR
jgi:hypothetical protein